MGFPLSGKYLGASTQKKKRRMYGSVLMPGAGEFDGGMSMD
jgi:hypothetical protein